MRARHFIGFLILILTAWRFTVADGASLFHTTPQPRILNILRQYAFHILFVTPASADAGIDWDDEASARKPIACLLQDQNPEVRTSPGPLPSIRERSADPAPTRQQSTLEQPFTIRTRGVRIVTRVGSSAPPPRRPRPLPRRSRGLVILSLLANCQACAGGDRGQWEERHG